MKLILEFDQDIFDNEDLIQTIFTKYFHSLNESKTDLKSIRELLRIFRTIRSTPNYPKFMRRQNIQFMIKKVILLRYGEFLEIKKS